MKFNLQYFAQVIDALGDETVKKKKVIPRPVNPNTGVTLGTYEEGQAEKARLDAIAAEKDIQVAETIKTPAATVSPTESIEDMINRIRRQKEVDNALAREATIKQGTTQLQSNLDRTQSQLTQQEESLDPRFGNAKASAVAGTRVSQNRLANITPFSGQQAGRTLRQAQGLESELQGRQSTLDTARTDEEQQIAFNRQQAIDSFNTGVTSLQQGATLNEINANAAATDLANARIFENNQLQASYEKEKATLAETREYNEYLMQVENATDRDIALFEQGLLEHNKELDFNIREAEEANDFARLQTLTAEKAANDLKIQGIKDSEAAARIYAKGAQDRATAEFKSSLTAEEDDTDFLSTADSILNPVTIDSISDNNKDSLEKLINDPSIYGNDITKLRAILDDQGITIDELEAYENWRDQALQAGN